MEVENLLKQLGLKYQVGGSGYLKLSCPFAEIREAHKGNDAHPSFVIWPQRNLAKCYGCHLVYDLHTFFADYSDFKKLTLDLDFLEFYFPPLEEETVEIENVVIHENILKSFSSVQYPLENYLGKRGINRKNIPLKLYHDTRSNNLVCPVRNGNGDLVGATSRNMMSKLHHHYFGMLTTKCLLGFERRKANRILVVEGLTDLLAAYDKVMQLELDYDVYATLTCSLRDWKARKLIDEDRPVTLGWDCDSAGLLGRKKALPKLSDALCVTDSYWADPKIDIGNMPIEDFQLIFD